MKNMKINEKLMTRIVSGGLSIVLVATGFVIGKLDSKNQNSNVNAEKIVNEYLEEYIAERSSLEEEIEKLLKQKEMLKQSKTFDVQDLVVMKHTKYDNQTDLYIVYPSPGSGIYSEYHGDFQAWYNLHEHTEEHVHDFCSDYVHFYEGRPLFDYLTQEEIEKVENNGGKITTVELDRILQRIREESKIKVKQ